MKKVLFATTALVLSAGFASAEVAVSGDGRMGFVYDGADLQFSSRIRTKFTMTGESDSGLSFGGSMRVDQQDEAGGKASAGTAGSVYVSGTYGKLSMGDVASAAEMAVGDLHDVGYTEGTFLGDPEEADYLVHDGNNLDQGPAALYEYSMGAAKLYASMTDGSTNACDAVTGTTACYDTTDSDMAWSLGAGYEASGYKVGLGYSKHGDASQIVLGGETTFNNVAVRAFYADASDAFIGSVGEYALPAGTELDKEYGISGAYTMANGVGLSAFWIRREVDFNGAVTTAEDSYDAYGIGASYDLGGGATLAGGIGKNDMYADNETRADMGIKFKF